MRIALFYHSLVSDWNHGNAHFLRGIASELQARGNEVRILEPQDSWSRCNLIRDCGAQAVEAFKRAFPHLSSIQYTLDQLRLEHWLDGVDLIIAHEWNHPRLIEALGEYRRRNSQCRAFFHDTHHRALTAENELARFDLSNYDGVLAYGASLKLAYERHGWGKQVHVWHEAADTRVFYPRNPVRLCGDVVWIGNWGDEERTEELREFFLRPVAQASLKASVFGVRYPHSALDELRHSGISHGGWLPNLEVPEVFAQFKVTVHVPRRPYTQGLRGIPTIRPFEALACGIPLVSAPWQDSEGLFRVGQDFLMARNGDDMREKLVTVSQDEALAWQLSESGLETIRDRHTCAHRVDELFAIYNAIRPSLSPEAEVAEVQS